MCPYVDSQLRLHSPPESQRGSRVPVGQSQDVVVKHGLLEGLSWRPPHCTSWWAKAEVLNEVRQEDKLATFFPISKGWHPPYLHISPDCQISRQSWVTSSVSCELHMGKTCLHQLSIGIFDYIHTTVLSKLPLWFDCACKAATAFHLRSDGRRETESGNNLHVSPRFAG